MDETTKKEIRERAAGQCEYCHLPEAQVLTPFQVEHVVAKQHRGGDTLNNLAYAFLRCNLHKGQNLTGIDPKTKKLTRLFNPRRHRWSRHFRWQGAMLIGKSAVGRTTVEVLAMNDLDEIVCPREPAGTANLDLSMEMPGADPRPRDEKRGETGTVLVVDDDAHNRDLLSRFLRRDGHTVSCAADARQAMTMIASQLFDLILLDIHLPDSDGVQALAALKADERYRHLPVIMISAFDEMDLAVRCIKMGAEDYLPKPFNPVLLKARVNAGLEKKRLRDREVLFTQQIQQEQKRSDELLHVIFPDAIVRELKTTSLVRPRRFDDVAVLFCDIADFTPFCDDHEPEEVMRHLQELIELWERLALRHQVEKIKTIGDAFMAAAGLLERPADHPVLHCVRCGLDMIAASRRLPIPWEVRVGIHFGWVVAGVIGCRHYLFDLWGDTVNTAARMESHGIPGAVTLSQPAWEAVAQHCCGEPLGRIDIKGKGPMEMVRVDRLRE